MGMITMMMMCMMITMGGIHDNHDEDKENQEKHMAPIDCSGLPRTAGFNSDQNLLN